MTAKANLAQKVVLVQKLLVVVPAHLIAKKTNIALQTQRGQMAVLRQIQTVVVEQKIAQSAYQIVRKTNIAQLMPHGTTAVLRQTPTVLAEKNSVAVVLVMTQA